MVDDSSSSLVSAVKSDSEQQQISTKESSNTRECWNCGRRHVFHKQELCLAYGKTCNKCHKQNHLAAKCRSKTTPKSVKSVEESDEIYQTHVPGTDIDDSQLRLNWKVAIFYVSKLTQEPSVMSYQCISIKRLPRIITSLT